MSDFELTAPLDPGNFSHGWYCQFYGKHGSAYVRRRVRFDDGKKVPLPHAPWLAKVGPNGKRKVELWFWSMEEALAWANGELQLAAAKELA